MQQRTTVGLALLLLLVLGCPAPLAAGPADDVPEARQVVVRGHKNLAEAIAAAAGGAEDGVGAILLDATPHTRAAAPTIRDALMALGTRRGVPRAWRIARLGDAFSPAVPDAARLAPLLPAMLRDDTTATDTVGALTRSVKSLGKGGAVIYLADWRFEDAHDVDGLVKVLRAKALRFGVVGSEAAFGRGWHDGIKDERARLGADSDAYEPSIGRRPYGPFDRDAPWHGGDTAAPQLPYRFSGAFWRTEFSASELRFAEDGVMDLGMLGGPPSDLEDLSERLGRKTESIGSSTFARFPLPSAFGPHALMRVAGLRGGRYVLWSWNPEHRVSIRYAPARCDMFGPDLRSRAAIRRTYSKQPLGVAMLRAWHALSERRSAVLAHTPPLGKGGRGPASIDLVDREHRQLATTWCDRGQHRAFLDRATAWRDALTQTIRDLDRVIAKHGAPAADTPPMARRLAADAALLRHALAVVRFELAEAIAVASDLPADPFGPKHCLALRPITYIERGDDPDAVRTTAAVPRDRKAGDALVRERAEHLRRFRGTPFGLQVGANTVDTWRLERMPRLEGSPTPPPGRAPAESGGDTPESPQPRGPGGPSGGGGPSTGGR